MCQCVRIRARLRVLVDVKEGCEDVRLRVLVDVKEGVRM